MDSTGPTIEVTLNPPDDLDHGGGDWRPTALMQRVSEYLATCPAPVSQTNVTDFVKGKRATIAQAITHLVGDGYVEATPGPRNSLMLRLIRPYAQDDE